MTPVAAPPSQDTIDNLLRILNRYEILSAPKVPRQLDDSETVANRFLNSMGRYVEDVLNYLADSPYNLKFQQEKSCTDPFGSPQDPYLVSIVFSSPQNKSTDYKNIAKEIDNKLGGSGTNFSCVNNQEILIQLDPDKIDQFIKVTSGMVDGHTPSLEANMTRLIHWRGLARNLQPIR
jgi:hypothetical protein